MPQLVLQILLRTPGCWRSGSGAAITGLGMTLDTAWSSPRRCSAPGQPHGDGRNLGSQWLIFLPCAYLIGRYGRRAAGGVLLSLYRVMASVIFAILWRRKHWADIRL